MEEYERVDKSLSKPSNFTVAPTVPVIIPIKAAE